MNKCGNFVHLSGYMVTPVTVTVFRTKLRRGEYEG